MKIQNGETHRYIADLKQKAANNGLFGRTPALAPLAAPSGALPNAPKVWSSVDAC